MPSSAASSQQAFQTGIPFGFHIYDLSKGIGQRFGKSILNTTDEKQKENNNNSPLPIGILHAAVVIFGHEYFFEGNISKRPAGCTRFGKNFSFIPSPLPATSVKTEEEFETWIRAQELLKYGAISYELCDNNCIHFCRDATLFLTGGKAQLPDQILNNTKPVLESPVGSLLMDFAKIMSNCGMLAGCEMMKGRRMCKTATYNVRRLMREGTTTSSTTSASDEKQKKKKSSEKEKENKEEEILQEIEPTKLHYFLVHQEPEEEYSNLISRLQKEIEMTFEDRAQQRSITNERMKELFNPASSSSSCSTSSSTVMTATEASTISTTIAQSLTSEQSCSSFTDLTQLLQILSHLSALHENLCNALAHDTVMRIIFRRLSHTFFCALPIPLKILVLEVFCNLTKSPICGSFLVRIQSFQAPLSFLISRGLLEPDSWTVVHRASCLLLNFMYCTVTLRHNALEEEVMSKGPNHNAVKCLASGMFLLRSVLPKVEEVITKNADNRSDDADSFSTPEKAHKTFLEKQEAEKLAKLQQRQQQQNNNKEKKMSSSSSSSTTSTVVNKWKSSISPDTVEVLEQNRENLLPPILEVSQAILENIVESILQFTTSGRDCTSVIVTHSMAPEAEVLRLKCATQRCFDAVHDLALIM